MKNKFNKMMFALVASFALMVSTVSATVVNVQIYSGSYGSEVSWDLSDATGTVILFGTGYSSNMTYDNYIDLVDGCYDMNMYDSCGDGWNGGTYTVLDSLTGNILYTGGLLVLYHLDQIYCASAQLDVLTQMLITMTLML